VLAEIEILGVRFRQQLPTVTGAYLVLEALPPHPADEYFANPFLCRINVDQQGNRWVQYSMEWSSSKSTPPDWTPIADNCGWFFSRRIERIKFFPQNEH
jgi:hypothetical protein